MQIIITPRQLSGHSILTSKMCKNSWSGLYWKAKWNKAGMVVSDEQECLGLKIASPKTISSPSTWANSVFVEGRVNKFLVLGAAIWEALEVLFSWPQWGSCPLSTGDPRFHFASWGTSSLGHCRSLKPTWEIVGGELGGESTKVLESLPQAILENGGGCPQPWWWHYELKVLAEPLNV